MSKARSSKSVRVPPKSMARRKVLGKLVIGLAAGSMLGAEGVAQERPTRRPVQRPVQRPSQRGGLALQRVPRRTFAINRGLSGSSLDQRLETLLREDLRIDPDRVQGTIDLVQSVVGDINTQQTGLLRINIGDFVNRGVFDENDDCAMLCSADQCDKLSCSGNACDGHTCGSQACDTHDCSGQACDRNGCHEETTSVMPNSMARSAWEQMEVLREMHGQLDTLFIEVQHSQVMQARQFRLR